MNIKAAVDNFGKFALACSGANQKILDREDCAGDKSKYAMIGMFIFLTAVFATLSAGYALYLGFKSIWVSALTGVLWGIFIFNLDRFVISTIRRKEIDSDLPLLTKVSLGLREFAKASPRLLLAILISLVISVPLEMKYFEPEIRIQINNRLRDEKIKDQNIALRDQSNDVKLREVENKSLQDQIEERVKRREQLRDQLAAEAAGIRGTGIYGYGRVTSLLKEQLANYEIDLKAFADRAQARIQENQAAIDKFRKENEALAATRDRQIEENKYSFLNSLRAMSELAAGSRSILWAQRFISFLILFLECTPILMKLIAGHGPYDSALAADEYSVCLKERRRVSDVNRKANHEEAFNSSKDALVLTAKEQLAQEAVRNLITLVQSDVDRATVNAAQQVVCDFESEFADSSNAQN